MNYSHVINNEEDDGLSSIKRRSWYDEVEEEEFRAKLIENEDLESKVVLSSSTSESEADNDNEENPDNSYYYNQSEPPFSEEETEKNKLRRPFVVNTKRQEYHPSKNCHFDRKSSSDESDKFRKYHLYLTSFETNNQPKIELNAEKFKAAMSNSLCPPFRVLQSRCGLLLTLSRSSDVDRIFNTDLANVFDTQSTIHVVDLSKNVSPFKKKVFFRTIPWAVTLKEIRYCLEKQGIRYGRIKRARNVVKVEVLNVSHEERLFKEGLNFYNVVSFEASQDVSRFNERTKSRDLIQCYRCQGFWHTAISCKKEVRCVRCGDHHDVEKCTTPKNNPICCNCRGSHHAAYKMCPARLKMMKNLQQSSDPRPSNFLVRAATS